MSLRHHHILLYDGEYDRLGELYSSLRPGVVIRELVHRHIQSIERKLNGLTDDSNPPPAGSIRADET